MCYVSNHFQNDLQISRTKQSKDAFGNNLKKTFVLPDYQSIPRGFVKEEDDITISDDEQLLVMESERFTIPEILFNPSDIGINQSGVAEAMMQSMKCLRYIEAGLVARNIVLTGGNVKFPNFCNRFKTDIRSLVNDDYDMNVYLPDTPDLYAWKGMQSFANTEAINDQFVSRSDYLENGHYYCNHKFYNSW